MLRASTVLLGVLTTACALCQQDKKLPEAPEPVKESVAGDAVYAPLAVGDAPPTLKTQFETYLVVTFGPRAIVSPAFSAAIKMARPPNGYPRIWRDGADAYGRNYGDALVSKVVLETTRYGTGALLREDFRYRRSPTATGFGRFAHAVGYTFVDTGYDGKRRIAAANFLSAAAAGFVPITYLPDGYNDPGDGARHFATHFGGLAFENVAREYAPDIARIFGGHHLPFPRLPIPAWYTKKLTVLQAPPPQPQPAKP